MSTVWLFVIAAVIAAAYFYYTFVMNKKRRAAFQAFVAQRGWNYAERDDKLVGLSARDPFGEGFGRRAEHVITGQFRGRPMVAFEYIYKTEEGSGDNRRTVTHHYTVVNVKTPADRPLLQVGREGIGSKILGAVGKKDLQLESEEFNKRFHIKCENDKFAYDVLHPRTMQWMLEDPRFQDQPFRFERNNLMCFRKGKLETEAIDGYANYLCDIVERVPEFVWK